MSSMNWIHWNINERKTKKNVSWCDPLKRSLTLPETLWQDTSTACPSTQTWWQSLILACWVNVTLELLSTVTIFLEQWNKSEQYKTSLLIWLVLTAYIISKSVNAYNFKRKCCAQNGKELLFVLHHNSIKFQVSPLKTNNLVSLQNTNDASCILILGSCTWPYPYHQIYMYLCYLATEEVELPNEEASDMAL